MEELRLTLKRQTNPDREMTTFALIHGAGDVGWYWHLVEAELRARGHDTWRRTCPSRTTLPRLSHTPTA